MVRTISNEADSSAAGGGRTQIPALEKISPSTAQLAPIEPVALGVREIQYNMSTSDRAIKEIASLQISLNYVQAGLQMTDITNQKNKMSQDFLKSNPTGEGYTKFMTDGYTSMVRNKIDNAPNREIGDYLQQYLNSSLPHVIDSSLKKEISVKKNFGISNGDKNKNVLLTQLVEHPNDWWEIKEQYSYCLTSMKGFLPPDEYEKYTSESWNDFGKILGEVMIGQNPDSALKFFKSGKLEGMVNGSTLIGLVKAAETQQEAVKRRHLLDLKIQNHSERIDKCLDRIGLRGATINGNITSIDIDSTKLSERTKAELQNYTKYSVSLKTREADRQNEIAELYLNGQPLEGYTQKEVNDFYDTIRLRKAIEVELTEGRKLTNEEKAAIVIHGNFNQTIHSLTRDLAIDLERGSPEEARSAAFAIEMIHRANCTKSIDSLDLKHEAMASQISHEAVYSNSDSKKLGELVSNVRRETSVPYSNDIIKMRDTAYKRYLPDKNNLWSQISPDTRGLLERSSTPGEQLLFQAQMELRDAFREGLKGSAALALMNKRLALRWGATDLNRPFDEHWYKQDDKFIMLDPPEKVLPEYASTPWLKNEFFESCELLTKAASKGGVVRLKRPLIKEYSSDDEKLKKSLVSTKYPIIEVNIGGKWQNRRLWCSPILGPL
jgi:hypothetical protein